MVCMLGHRSILRAACCYLLLTSALTAGQNATLNFTELEASANQEMAATKTPGAAIGVVREGRLVYAKGFGTSNIETGVSITPETLFRLGSTTKMLTAAAVATLVAEGKLDFQEPVGKYIHGLDPAIAALTANQLLSHTAGLKDEAVMNGRHDEAALGEEIRAWKPDWLFTKPGAIFSYANPGYWLAGYLAETVAGKPYADVMQDLVFGPIGMVSSTLRPLMAMTRPLSQGHDLVNGKVSVLRPAPDNAANWPAGSVFSNLSDLSRFVIAAMNEGKLDGKQVLSPKVVRALTTPHAAAPGWQTRYGYGLDVQESDGVLVWTHGGARAGYGSFIAMLPGQQAAVIVLCNRSGQSLEKTRLKIIEMLGVPPPERHDGMAGNAIPMSEFVTFVGSYRNGETTTIITEKHGKLFIESQELRKGVGGWLLTKSADGKADQQIFAVPGQDGKIEYLYAGGRAAVRVN
jgi:CubicO group peptidase (beta-lactamase class C family)